MGIVGCDDDGEVELAIFEEVIGGIIGLDEGEILLRLLGARFIYVADGDEL
jgi:hypothetical protein